MKNIVFTTTFLILTFVINVSAKKRPSNSKNLNNVDFCESEDGSWSPYGDTKCIKLFDVFKNFHNAEEVCSKSDKKARLVTITSASEQTFLVDFLFSKKQIADSIWLGAKYDGKSVRFQWQKSTDTNNLTYSNWRSKYPTGTGNDCVQLIGGAGEGLGEWVNEPCTKGNRVVCEKKQVWSNEKLQKIILEIEKELTATKVKQEVISKKLETTVKELESTKIKQDVTTTKLKTTEKELEKTNKKLNSLLSQPSKLPAGYIYLQLPWQSPPDKLWPSHKWDDVSNTFGGAFFRVLGQGSSGWQSLQPQFVPHIDKVKRNWCLLTAKGGGCNHTSNIGGDDPKANPYYQIDLSDPGMGGSAWSKPVWTSHTYEMKDKNFEDKSGIKNKFYGDFHYYHNSGGEVRPKNYAIKVWKLV